MKPGHPFETEALDKLRSQQRRALRMVSDWLFEDFAPTEGVSADSPEVVGLLEHELRTEAEKTHKELDEGLLSRMEDHTRMEVLLGFLSQHDTAVKIETQSRAMPSHVFRNRVAELREHASGIAIYEHPERHETALLARYVRLLVWADDLADDGYRDPRLPQAPESSK